MSTAPDSFPLHPPAGNGDRSRAAAALKNVARLARCIIWEADVRRDAEHPTLPDGRANLHWDIRLFDEAAARHVVPLEVPEGRRWIDVWVGCRDCQDFARMDQTSSDALLGGKESYAQEFRCTDRLGREHWLYEDVSIEPAGDGRWLLVGVCMDVTQRKHDERELRLKAAILEAQNEASLDGILVVSHEHGVVSHNRQLFEMWKFPYPLVGRRPAEVTVPWIAPQMIDPDAYAEQTRRVYADPEKRSHDPLLLKDGRVIDRFSAPIKDPEGVILGRVWFFRDVTDIRRAAGRVEVSELRYRSMFEQAPLGIATFDPDGHIRAINPAWEEMWGLTFQQAAHYNILHDDRMEEAGVMEAVRRGFAGTAVSTDPIPFTPRAGKFAHESKWVRSTLYPVKNPDGTPREVVLFQENLTAQKRAEEELRSVAAHARCILWQARITAGPGWERMSIETRRWQQFEWDLTVPDEKAAQRVLPLDAPAGQTYRDAWIASRHADDFQAMRDRSSRALLNGDAGYAQEFRCHDRHGQIRWLREDVSIEAVRTAAGEAGRWRAFGVVFDITEQKEVEQALRDREQHFRELAESHRHLHREVDHRVRNNLAGLLATVPVVRSESADVDAFAAAMESRLEGMLNIHEMLAAGNWREVELRSLAESLLAKIERLAPRPIPVAFTGPPAAVHRRHALPLTIILVEWFTNSFKYGAHSQWGGRLEVSWELTEPADDGHPRIRLRWRETCPLPIPRPRQGSLGTELVRGLASNELQGRCALYFPECGADHQLEFPSATGGDSSTAGLGR